MDERLRMSSTSASAHAATACAWIHTYSQGGEWGARKKVAKEGSGRMRLRVTLT